MLTVGLHIQVEEEVEVVSYPGKIVGWDIVEWNARDEAGLLAVVLPLSVHAFS